MPTIIHDPIKVADQDFLISHLVSDCPERTVVRELLMNAVQNAAKLTKPGRVEWFTEELDGVRKLGLFNEGPGMSGHDLSRLMNVASTGQTLGTDQNFGQGGKVSGLKVSPAGLIYRSCKGGSVREIRLQADPDAKRPFPVYVKFKYMLSDGNYDHCIDVTNEYQGRKDRLLDRDWTEVLLVGRTDDQDTVSTLLGDGSRTNWLIREINQRFYRLPSGVEIKNADVTSGQRNQRNAAGLEELTQRYCRKDGGRYEDVSADHPEFGSLVIRYCRLQGNWSEDAAGSSRGRSMEAYGIGTMGDHICLVWKDECYEMRTGWSRVSGPFGVTFGTANLAIQIKLPDTAPVKNNTYRDKLLRQANDELVQRDDFAEVVRANRPQWLIDYMEELAQRDGPGTNVMERLQDFLRQLQVEGDRRPGVEPGGDQQGETLGGSGGGSGGRGGSRHRAAAGRPTGQDSSGIPRVQFTSDTGLLSEMQGRAAMYRREENTVFLNRDHFRYTQEKQAFADEQGADAEHRAHAERLFDAEYMVSAGKLVLQACLFRNRPNWNDDAFQEALSIGSMTIHLASPDIRTEARRRLRQRVGSA